ncbi:MAG TPA: 5-formyltetrahydrofolate cyclo-ligase [Casimicrobiaceae bacterium]|jgi:5-formyltetrahydrofolate cyclo-ligase|nr:5-formyltetrahydrofolate cyclo-ligase [Casimicrobiaceae bacterium]
MPSSSESVRIAGGALREAKRALRERILRARDALPATVRAEAGAAIVRTLTARPDYAAARTLLLTLPYGSEWDTRLLLAVALEQGKTIAVPRVNLERRMLDIHVVCDLRRDVEPGYRGIPEPSTSCPPMELAAIDWVLVPGVAFDARGHRVGYGGGYYDRLLPALPNSAARIAAAFELQIVDEVPTAPHDFALDAIVTELQVIVPRRPATAWSNGLAPT